MTHPLDIADERYRETLKTASMRDLRRLDRSLNPADFPNRLAAVKEEIRNRGGRETAAASPGNAPPAPSPRVMAGRKRTFRWVAALALLIPAAGCWMAVSSVVGMRKPAGEGRAGVAARAGFKEERAAVENFFQAVSAGRCAETYPTMSESYRKRTPVRRHVRNLEGLAARSGPFHNPSVSVYNSRSSWGSGSRRAVFLGGSVGSRAGRMRFEFRLTLEKGGMRIESYKVYDGPAADSEGLQKT